MKYFYGVELEEKRKKLLQCSAAKGLTESIIKKADAAIKKEYKALKMSDYMLFIETGDRSTFESGYFERRNNCSYISIAYWLTEDEKYKKPLIDLIFHICNEFSWCVPAHAVLDKNPGSEDIIETIDLFQSETSRLLTEVASVVGDKLPYYVADRIKYEIRRRIIKPLQERTFFWMSSNANWAAVCAGSTLVAVLTYADDKEKERIIPILNGAIDSYIGGFNDDGCCLEGYEYWNYGFGHFIIYAALIYEYSQGKINLFDNEKVKQIALYPQRVRLGESKIVSFADGNSEFSFSPGAFGLLRKVYGEEVIYPKLKFATMNGNVFSIKDFLWFDTDYEEDKNKYLTTYFEASQCYVKQGSKYSFAAKGGHNDEQHNHNDIGSFMIVTNNDDIPLTDFGAAIYTKETFSPIRFTLLNNSSRGHSVPIINGQYQIDGENYRAKNVKSGNDFFEADIEGAYESGLVKRINRRFTLKEESVVLCDTIEYSERTESVTERMVSWTKPEICDGYVDLKTARILFDIEKYTVEYSQDSYRNHENTEDVKVFLIDFKGVNKKETTFEFEILIK